MRALGEIQEHLPILDEGGLTPDDAARSRRLFGSNELTRLPRKPIWKKFLEKLDEPIIKILLLAALLSMVVDLFKPPPELGRYVTGGIVVGLALLAVLTASFLGWKEFLPALLFGSALVIWPVGLAWASASVDGLAVMIAVILATGVAFLSEYKSDRALDALNARKESLVVKVLRGGAVQTHPVEQVVVGDTIVLETGDEVPADGRVIDATGLLIDQSLMTGESEAVEKEARPAGAKSDEPEQPGCLYRGTQVVAGVGRMIATEVGDATMLGQIARRLATATSVEDGSTEAGRVQRKLTLSRELTPLQHKLERLATAISRIGYTAAGAIFLVLLLQGVAHGEVGFLSPGILESARHLLDYFMYMVIVIVVAVPEGLPMSVTLSLALAMRKMTRSNSLVRQLVACETIGSATVICTDKTGTLTQNKMQVTRLCWDGCTLDRETSAWPKLEAAVPTPNEGSPLEWVAIIAAVCSTAHLEVKEGMLAAVGSSTEGALLFWLRESDIDYKKLRAQLPPVHQAHFSSERKRMTAVVRLGGSLVALVKGAPERILERSRFYQSADGAVVPWSDAAAEDVRARLKDAAGLALRTLAFAYAVLKFDDPDTDSGDGQEALEGDDLVYVGFVAIRDPLRADVKEAIEDCRRAGIEVKMITGDSVETARAIGTEVGLLARPDSLILTSAEFNAFTDGEIKDKMGRLRIMARARPLDKLRLVTLLQEQNEVVAVTGDGTNDAPALKKADVGLAMGRAGTEVAKEASKIVLLDDAFSTIVKAVHWGRALYENIQRFIQFQLTINVSALAIAFLGPLLGVPPPFTILQLLWINVIMDTFAAIALCSEPPRPGLMSLPPKRRDESIVTPAMFRSIAATACFFIVVMIALLLGMEHGRWFKGTGPHSTEFRHLTVRQVSIFFTVYIFFQVWNEINCRSLVPEVSGFRGVVRNPIFLAILALIVVMQVLIVSLGGEVFKVEPLSFVDWLAIAAGTSTVLVFGEFTRRIRWGLARGARK
jgi:Ca2+-transporting ATPase